MKKSILVLGLAMLFFASCTENARARNWGGTETIELNANEILLNATWKKTDLWVLTQDTITKVNHFREHSSFGVIEGEIILK